MVLEDFRSTQQEMYGAVHMGKNHFRDTSGHDRQEAENSGPVVGITSKAPSKLLPPVGSPQVSTAFKTASKLEVGHSDESLRRGVHLGFKP